LILVQFTALGAQIKFSPVQFILFALYSPLAVTGSVNSTRISVMLVFVCGSESLAT